MPSSKNLGYCALLATLLVLSRSASADDLKQYLQRLDAAAKDFHTTTAAFEFDTIQTEPVPDTDVLKGTVYYQRSGGHFQMAAHAHDRNKQPSAMTYIISGGTIRQSDTGKASDAHTIDQASKYESYFMLGFGASGAELQAKWDITYIGPDKTVTTEKGVATDKLELVAKDPTIRKNVPKITLWMDTAHAVSIKQVFDEGSGGSRVCHYTDFKINQPLPSDAFTFAK